jgi:hypothetical protein
MRSAGQSQLEAGIKWRVVWLGNPPPPTIRMRHYAGGGYPCNIMGAFSRGRAGTRSSDQHLGSCGIRKRLVLTNGNVMIYFDDDVVANEEL